MRHRILFLLRRLDLNDGVSSHLYTLVSGLRAHGHETLIITGKLTGQNLMTDRLRMFNESGGLLVSNGKGGINNIIRMIFSARGLGFSPTIIHAHGGSSAVAGRIASIINRCGLVTTFHNPNSDNAVGIKRWFKSKFIRYVLGGHFVAISSDFYRKITQDYRISPRYAHLIYNGVDHRIFSVPDIESKRKARQRFKVDDAASLVVTLPGRLEFFKGHTLLIDAVRDLRASGEKIICLFPGSGPDDQAIREYALESAEDHYQFRFTGQLADLQSIFFASDIAVLPSEYEGFGLVIAEAMLCGCVPIRTPAGGARDQIEHGVNGFIVPFNDSKAIATSIRALFDSQLRTRLSEAAVEKARRQFVAEVMLEATLRSYDIAASRHGMSDV